MSYKVYILASKPHGTIYVGMTRHMGKWMYEHKNAVVEGFTKKFQIKRLVYIESFDSLDDAWERERKLKRWRRVWKDELIESMNPTWEDLSLNGSFLF